jgi:parallel beta-helix repeat protein
VAKSNAESGVLDRRLSQANRSMMTAILDRSSVTNRHQTRLSCRSAGASPLPWIVAISLLLPFGVASFDMLVSNESSATTPVGYEPSATIEALFSHDPILIIGDGEFTNASGVTRGSGTESDPYIIEGWDIQGPRGVTRIDIQDTNAHFVIRNCSLRDSEASSGGSGIALLRCFNGTIEHCTCFNNDEGIIARQSTGIAIHDCHCYNNSRGISVSGSELCLVTSNTCSDGNQYGIYIENLSGNNTVIGNDCTNNSGTGISMASCWNNSVAGNICNQDGHGFEFNGAHNNCLIGNSCNFNIEEGFCLFSSDNNTFEGNNCSDNTLSGVRFVNSNNNTLIRTEIHSNGYCGILLESNLPYGLSRDNLVIYNNILDNAQWGIVVSSASEFNRIWNNTFFENNGAGDKYDPSHVQAYDDGTNNPWNSTDGYGNYWSDWTGPDADSNGVVDDPYLLDGSASAEDYRPLTTSPSEPIPEFGAMPLVLVALLVLSFLTNEACRSRTQRP